MKDFQNNWYGVMFIENKLCEFVGSLLGAFDSQVEGLSDGLLTYRQWWELKSLISPTVCHQVSEGERAFLIDSRCHIKTPSAYHPTPAVYSSAPVHVNREMSRAFLRWRFKRNQPGAQCARISGRIPPANYGAKNVNIILPFTSQNSVQLHNKTTRWPHVNQPACLFCLP